MKANQPTLILALIISIICVSCKKEKNNPTPSAQPKVYVIGSEDNSFNVGAAKLWEDGSEKSITSFAGERNCGIISSIFVSDSRIYFGGNEITEGKSQTAEIWDMNNTSDAINAYSNSNKYTLTNALNEAFVTDVYQATNRGTIASGAVSKGNNYIAAFWPTVYL